MSKDDNVYLCPKCHDWVALEPEDEGFCPCGWQVVEIGELIDAAERVVDPDR
jgi:hypothetical protein